MPDQRNTLHLESALDQTPIWLPVPRVSLKPAGAQRSTWTIHEKERGRGGRFDESQGEIVNGFMDERVLWLRGKGNRMGEGIGVWGERMRGREREREQRKREESMTTKSLLNPWPMDQPYYSVVLFKEPEPSSPRCAHRQLYRAIGTCIKSNTHQPGHCHHGSHWCGCRCKSRCECVCLCPVLFLSYVFVCAVL